MGELIIITIMAGGILEVIRLNGGIRFIIQKLTAHIRGKRGAELSIGFLVALSTFAPPTTLWPLSPLATYPRPLATAMA